MRKKVFKMINKEEQKEMEARQNSTEVPLIEAVDLKPENCLRKSDSKNCRSANQIKLKHTFHRKTSKEIEFEH